MTPGGLLQALSDRVDAWDAALPPWAPWAALALALAIALALALWRRRAPLSRAQAEIARLQHSLHLLEADTHARALERAATDARREAALQEAERRLQDRETSLLAARSDMETLRAQHEARLADLASRHADAEQRLAAHQAQTAEERRATADKMQTLLQLRDEMARNFKDLADASLKSSNEEISRISRERLEQTLNPLKEHVALFQTELRNVHEGALRDRQALRTEIEALTRRSEEVSKEATALTRALKGDKQRQGAWGEMILETLLERSGLRRGMEYVTQSSHTDDEGARLRSDVIVNMPNGSALVVDSKVSLIDYETAVNAEAEDDAAAARRRHVAALRRHIDTLGAKTYQHQAGMVVDYVVMFIPIEGALSEALREAGDLTQYAMQKNVMIATPTTLLMALRTVASFWTIDRRNRNAEEIARRAGLLYDKVAGFVDAMDGVGKALDGAQKSYGVALDRLSRGSGNLLGQVDLLKRLGARTSRQIAADFDPAPDLPQDDTLPSDTARLPAPPPADDT